MESKREILKRHGLQMGFKSNYASWHSVLQAMEDYATIRTAQLEGEIARVRGLLDEQQLDLQELAYDWYNEKKEVERLRDSEYRRTIWLDKAKNDAGYDRNTSFDIVWADALKALQQFKKDNLI